MTQKEKLMRATMLAQRVKSLANSLESDMYIYDCSWPRTIIEDLRTAADEYLKLK